MQNIVFFPRGRILPHMQSENYYLTINMLEQGEMIKVASSKYVFVERHKSFGEVNT